jgi:hypothetical protein
MGQPVGFTSRRTDDELLVVEGDFDVPEPRGRWRRRSCAEEGLCGAASRAVVRMTCAKGGPRSPAYHPVSRRRGSDTSCRGQGLPHAFDYGDLAGVLLAKLLANGRSQSWTPADVGDRGGGAEPVI